jgi:hypothetical protein
MQRELTARVASPLRPVRILAGSALTPVAVTIATAVAPIVAPTAALIVRCVVRARSIATCIAERLEALQDALSGSSVFQHHQFIGSSIYFVADRAGRVLVSMIDFGVTTRCAQPAWLACDLHHIALPVSRSSFRA